MRPRTNKCKKYSVSVFTPFSSSLPILEICALHLTHPSAHTPGAVDSHLCCSARGAVGSSVPCSRAPRRGIKRWRVLYIHSPDLQFLPDLRLETATFELQVPLSIH